MIPIAAMPCAGVIQSDDPGYRPCSDCQGLRRLCGMPTCGRHPDEFGAAPAEASAEDNTGHQAHRIEEFRAWLDEKGHGPKFAFDTVKGAKRCLDSGIVSSDEITAERLPNLARSTLGIYRAAFRKYETFLQERPEPADVSKPINSCQIDTSEPVPKQERAPIPPWQRPPTVPRIRRPEKARGIETAEAVPEVVDAPEIPAEPREEVKSVEISEEPVTVEQFARVCRLLAEASPASGDVDELLCTNAISNAETNDLLREVLAELRRPKVYQLRMTGAAMLIEEVAP